MAEQHDAALSLLKSIDRELVELFRAVQLAAADEKISGLEWISVGGEGVGFVRALAVMALATKSTVSIDTIIETLDNSERQLLPGFGGTP